MTFPKTPISGVISLIITIIVSSVYAEVFVQVNLNRPLNDVNEKFVSFTVEPADLYRALDGPNRKSLTHMATLLGSSYIKFGSDYNFIPDTETKYRNPTKTVWKGFNRWTSAVNWTMIIPMPYNDGEWDPMESLRILNSSYLTGITDCIWQLGTEFGPSVTEYLNDLNTLNLMVDSFNPYVDDWEVTGAEIPLGSTSDEVKRYIESSKDLSAAFNWLQPADPSTTNPLIGSAYEHDRILRAMFSEKVPVWLNFTPKDRAKNSKQRSSTTSIISKTNAEIITDALRWAQTLGEAASSGFDAVFRRTDQDDLEYSSPSFFVTMLFKKVMGSRVFPARPFTIFLRTNKLYTHCANSISGGVAFMIVNPDDDTKQVSVRSNTKLTGDEYWQYILTFKKNNAYLNSEKLSINSTLEPQVKTRSPNKAMQLNAPAKSVGFWVLPHAELEHCQFTEIDVDDLEQESTEDEVNMMKRHISSSDKLLQQLIHETALLHSASMKHDHRRRRYATFSNRARHIVLEDKGEHTQTLTKLFEPLSLEEKTPKKREEVLEYRRLTALKWIKDLLDTALKDREDLLSLKRNTRSTDDYFGAIFGAKGGKKKAPVVKKIIEIRKPEKKSTKPSYDPEHFDEEEFFKKMGSESEPESARVPEGDVHLRHITNVDGEDLNNSDERGKRKAEGKKIHRTNGKETRNEMKPLRLLPTEFYEALPLPTSDQTKPKKGKSWNALLFPEPFTKKTIKSNTLDETSITNNADPDVENVGAAKFQTAGQLAEDFLLAQEELARSFLRDNEKDDEKKDERESDNNFSKKKVSETVVDNDDEMLKKIKSLRNKYIDYLTENLENYFSEHGTVGDVDVQKSLERSADTTTETPWWNLSSLRKRRSPRALRYELSEDDWASNMITKDVDLLPLSSVTPKQLVDTEHRTSNRLQLDDDTQNNNSNGYLKAMRKRVSSFVDIVTRHVNEWYNTITKPVEDGKMVPDNSQPRTRGRRRN
ncbi:uncharacterized protein LOC129243436 [Anastrepha obliqua]|uniref:uncharacterized protein LOC129243436 n=1 Tax=Anastrepha obliqua TaxID=95512 RepID=UPI0024091B1A|nr:uncharacterized protein LOC129243436 [Anastrepha obliqua]